MSDHLTAHKYAGLFPLATDTELEEMAADIAERGLLHPIIMLDGKILDGRNRHRACVMAGEEPLFVEYAGNNPLADVISWNLHRRQLSISQRAVLALKLKPAHEKAARERQRTCTGGALRVNLSEGEKGTSAEAAADAVGVSASSVKMAAYVERNAPDLIDLIMGGEMTINAAVQETKEKVREATPGSTKTKIIPQPVCQAMHYAGFAIAQLDRIMDDDPTAPEALDRVEDYINERRRRL